MIRPLLLSVSLSLSLFVTAAGATEWGLDPLMQSLALKKNERASFVEKKTISYLDKPVESSGELYYRSPDLLEKITVKPKPELLRIEGDRLTIERGKKKHQVSLAEYPEIGGFVDSIRGTLAGDKKALERSYQLQLDGIPERWTLLLTPTDPRMIAMIQKITIGGRRGDVRSIEIQQADGDRSVMTIERISEQ